MKIAIIGAGVIGVCTAYELARDGHEVTVFEKCSSVGELGSFAIAGLMAPSCSLPLVTPPWPAALATGLLRRQGSISTGGIASLRELRWLWNWNRSRAPGPFLARLHCARQLMELSLSRLQELGNGLQLEFERSQGSMVLLRSAADRSTYAPLLAELSAAKASYHELSPAQAQAIEPGLQAGAQLHCALHFPNDELGNCRQFAMLLKNAAIKLGAQFNFNACVDSITPAPSVTLSLNNRASQPSFDHVVVCTGAAYPALLEHLKLRLPMQGVRGYSLSLPVREPIHAPRSAVLDAHSRILITRLGNRVRVSGAAHLGGPSGFAQKRAVHSLYRAVQQHFPGSVQFAQPVQPWSAVRPMLPDGLPVIGDSGVPGVWLNFGHGASGWAMACGSARILTALVGQQAPEIDIACLAARRFQG